jgi:hypothetical protein
VKKISVLVLCVLLSGCMNRYISNGENLYLRSRNGVFLAVPSPLTSSNLSDFYVLPPQQGNPRVSIAPPV